LPSRSNFFPRAALVVQLEDRAFWTGYWQGQLLQEWTLFDPLLGHTRAAEAALQLDAIHALGVNTIRYELRTIDPGSTQTVFPTCLVPWALGFDWPQPTATELTSLVAFLDLLHSRGMHLWLETINMHMEEQPPTNSQMWLGSILGAIKDHPALDLVLFDGDTKTVDTNGDRVPDACRVEAEAPLFNGLDNPEAQYVKWALQYAMSLDTPPRKLSAEAIEGAYFLNSQPANPFTTGGHFWRPVVVMKQILDALNVPADQRTYALSLYEHNKCMDAGDLPCTDAEPHIWTDQVMGEVAAIIGLPNGARVVLSEMGVFPPVTTAWGPEQALASLVFLMRKYGFEGGAYWRWVNTEVATDGTDQDTAVKRRGLAFTYNVVGGMMKSLYTTGSPPRDVHPLPRRLVRPRVVERN
jgi:hypothetical protein